MTEPFIGSSTSDLHNAVVISGTRASIQVLVEESFFNDGGTELILFLDLARNSQCAFLELAIPRIIRDDSIGTFVNDNFLLIF